MRANEPGVRGEEISYSNGAGEPVLLLPPVLVLTVTRAPPGDVEEEAAEEGLGCCEGDKEGEAPERAAVPAPDTAVAAASRAALDGDMAWVGVPNATIRFLGE